MAIAGGKLDRVREATSSGSSTRDDDGRRDDDDGDYDDEDDSFFNAFLRALFSSGDADERDLRYSSPRREPTNTSATFFSRYPYADGYGGNLLLLHPRNAMATIKCPPEEPFCVEDAETCVEGSCYVFDSPSVTAERAPQAVDHRVQMTTEFGTDVDGLYRTTFGLWLESSAPIVIESRFDHWLEPLPDGGFDELLFGDANLMFRVSSLRRFQAHFGGGVRLLFDGAGEPTAGFNGTLSFEGYPAAPLTLRSIVDLGNLGPAFVASAQATAGVALHRFELFGGYSGMRIGPVVFHGPVVGLKLHL